MMRIAVVTSAFLITLSGAAFGGPCPRCGGSHGGGGQPPVTAPQVQSSRQQVQAQGDALVAEYRQSAGTAGSSSVGSATRSSPSSGSAGNDLGAQVPAPSPRAALRRDIAAYRRRQAILSAALSVLNAKDKDGETVPMDYRRKQQLGEMVNGVEMQRQRKGKSVSQKSRVLEDLAAVEESSSAAALQPRNPEKAKSHSSRGIDKPFLVPVRGDKPLTSRSPEEQMQHYQRKARELREENLKRSKEAIAASDKSIKQGDEIARKSRQKAAELKVEQMRRSMEAIEKLREKEQKQADGEK